MLLQSLTSPDVSVMSMWGGHVRACRARSSAPSPSTENLDVARHPNCGQAATIDYDFGQQNPEPLPRLQGTASGLLRCPSGVAVPGWLPALSHLPALHRCASTTASESSTVLLDDPITSAGAARGSERSRGEGPAHRTQGRGYRDDCAPGQTDVWPDAPSWISLR